MSQTPEEKAKELFNHYHNLIQDVGGELDNETLICILAKQCALFEVRQILKENGTLTYMVAKMNITSGKKLKMK